MKLHLSNALFAALSALAYDLPSFVVGQDFNERIDATLVFPRNAGSIGRGIPSYAKDTAYLFTGTDTYWKMDFTNDNAMTGPKATSTGFDGLPEKIDATLVFGGYQSSWNDDDTYYHYPYPWWTKNMAYVFSGDEYWKWDLINDEYYAGPKKISDGFPGLPNKIDATFVFDRNRNIPWWTEDMAYIFSGDEYWKWNLHTDEYYAGPKKISDGFPGLPNDIDAALYMEDYSDDIGYFFKDDLVYLWDITEDEYLRKIHRTDFF